MIAKLNSKKFFFSSTLALGVLTGVGIATAPAQAGQLSWSDGTSDFLSQLGVDANNAPIGDFQVTFSPAEINGNGQADISTANGEFVDEGLFTPSPPQYLTQLTPVPGDFDYVGALSAAAPQLSVYELGADLTFSFLNNGVTTQVTYGQGSTFLGEYDIDAGTGQIEGVEFEALELEGEFVTINGVDYLPDNTLPDPTLTGLTLTFDEPAAGTRGEYSAGTTVASEAVPEPASILGLLAVGGLGVAMKRKKQS